MKTIGERITRARQATVLLKTGLLVMSRPDIFKALIDEDDIRESLAPLADTASTELLWLTTLPTSVLGAPSPNWDEQVSLDVEQPEEGAKQLVEAALVKALVKPKKRAGAQ